MPLPDKYTYISPGAMAILQSRRALQTGGVGGVGDLPPPQEGPPDGGPSPADPPKPAPRPDYTQRAIYRANREREFLASNPGRRPGPLGVNQDGSIAYDPSTAIGEDAIARMRREAALQGGGGTGPRNLTPPVSGVAPTARPGLNSPAGAGSPPTVTRPVQSADVGTLPMDPIDPANKRSVETPNRTMSRRLGII